MSTQRQGWDVAAALVLLIAAYTLFAASNHSGYAYGYGYGSRMYEEGVYFERLRMIVCGAWIFAAIRFYVMRWFPAVFVSGIIAWLFNPIEPVTMRRYEWQPYDHWTMILSVVAAVVLIVVVYRRNIPDATKT
jgi:hypothetical protein